MAEMHGELLEFNENLQKTVQTKDGIIARLKEDLISLRGRDLTLSTRERILIMTP